MSSQASRLEGLDRPTVWTEFSPLSAAHNAVTLGQGFPNWPPPKFAIDAFHEALDAGEGNTNNQYTRPECHPRLAKTLAEDYSNKLNREIDWASEVASGVGCTQVLYLTMQGLINPGDEVVLFEPAFDIYSQQIKLAGGKPVFCPLLTKDGDNANDCFVVDWDKLEASVTEKSKALIINTPHNPTGKIFSLSEMERISEIVAKFPNLIVITDEVYEHIIFDTENSPHLHFASLPGMYERTLTLSSSGKTFSATGWKVGWAIGPSHLVKCLTNVQTWCCFSIPTTNQEAVAICLEKARTNGFYAELSATYKKKRDVLCAALTAAGISPVTPAGGFFVCGNTAKLEFPAEYYSNFDSPAAPTTNPLPRDWALARYLTIERRIGTIPPSAFYSKENIGNAKDLLRFAYCKTDNVLEEAQQVLKDAANKKTNF